jgi:hypothetical protein
VENWDVKSPSVTFVAPGDVVIGVLVLQETHRHFMIRLAKPLKHIRRGNSVRDRKWRGEASNNKGKVNPNLEYTFSPNVPFAILGTSTGLDIHLPQTQICSYNTQTEFCKVNITHCKEAEIVFSVLR